MTRARAVSGRRPGGVHRGQDVLGGGALRLELEVEVLAVAHEAVDAAGEADPVLLEAVPEARLRHALIFLELERQTVQVVEELRVEALDVAGHDRPQQQATEPGRRRDRQVATAEGHAAGRRDGPGVEDLEVGQDHRVPLRSDDRPELVAPGRPPAR